MRAFWLRGRLLSSSGFPLGTLILERALDLLALLTIWLIVITTTHFQLTRPRLVCVVSILTILGILVLGAMVTMAARIESLEIRVTYALFGNRPITEKLVSTAQPPFTVFKKNSLSLMLGLITLSGGAWVLEGAVFWMVAKALLLPMGAASPWLAFVLGNFAAMIPSAPGYIGTFHTGSLRHSWRRDGDRTRLGPSQFWCMPSFGFGSPRQVHLPTLYRWARHPNCPKLG